ncbi:MFS transporter [Alsobacter sp. KACC 23698]|uniref:MFS transporter n=1 Tax=Alsobacter sp. KACC 23698 TaxID=3149229 RepID=A0AAU7JDE5_9HYPH
MPIAVYALTAGAFGIGATEFVIMGLLLQVAGDLHVSLPLAGLLVSAYALGVTIGAPTLTFAARSLPRRTVLLGLMAVFVAGNIACALAPNYAALVAARIVTSLAHGTFFGVGSVVAADLAPPDRKASAIAVMFTGLTVATLLGVPAGAWIGLTYGWRATFWAVAGVGVLAFAILAAALPPLRQDGPATPVRRELAALLRAPVLLALATTTLGYAGVFAAFTYIQPMLTRVTGIAEASVSPILLVFGLGLAVGNIAGGKLADRLPRHAALATLLLLTGVLAVFGVALRSPATAIAAVGLLGAAGFATVAPLQMRVLDQAGDAGRNLASSANIAAFNLGNALGAWAGGAALSSGFGLEAVPLVGAGLSLLGVMASLLASRAPQPLPTMCLHARGPRRGL